MWDKTVDTLADYLLETFQISFTHLPIFVYDAKSVLEKNVDF
jgi:hypothetical protein